MKKPIKFVPPFFSIKVVNKVCCSLVLEDFSTDHIEACQIRDFYQSCWPSPMYSVTYTGWPVLPVMDRCFEWKGVKR